MRIIFTFLIIFLFTTISAQVVNIENRRLNDGTYGFSGSLDASFSAQKQKDLLMSFNFKPLIQYKFNTKRTQIKYDTTYTDSSEVKPKIIKPASYRHILLLLNDVTYTGAKGVKYANFGMSHFRYSYRIDKTPVETETFTQIQYNQLLLQKVRFLLGTGLRIKALDLEPDKKKYDKRAVRLFIGSSLFYEYEEINYKDRPMDFENALRWSTYLSSYLNFKHFEFSFTTYIQPNILNFKDTRLSGEYALLLRVTDAFSVKLAFNHFNDTKPPIGVNKNTFYMSVGFSYKLDNFKMDKEVIGNTIGKIKSITTKKSGEEEEIELELEQEEKESEILEEELIEEEIEED